MFISFRCDTVTSREHGLVAGAYNLDIYISTQQGILGQNR